MPKVLFIIHERREELNPFPLGIAYLAAVLKKEGAEVKVCCQNIFHWSNEAVAEFFLENESYDLIGIGFMEARFKATVVKLCQTVNKFKKNAWLVLGGHGPSAMPEYILEETKADVAAIGEAEETIIELLKCKLTKGDLSQIKGIAWRQGNEVIINQKRKPIFDLDSIPFPEWSLFPIEKYSMGIITGRGCINCCNFCYRLEKGIRLRSIKNVIEEIKILNQKYGVSFFNLYDEMFNFPKKRTFEFCQALKEDNLKIKFTCHTRVDTFDEESAVWLKESGCQLLNFGFESADQNVLNLMSKNTTIQQNIRAVEIARQAGLKIVLSFLWGNKGDTEKSLRDNVRFIKKYNTYNRITKIGLVTPYPGSELYDEAIKMGLLSGPADFFEKFKSPGLLTVNFTDIPEDKFYKLLFEANKELILDHFEQTTQNMAEANKLIQIYYDLYFGGKINSNFQGGPIRQYERENQTLKACAKN